MLCVLFRHRALGLVAGPDDPLAQRWPPVKVASGCWVLALNAVMVPATAASP